MKGWKRVLALVVIYFLGIGSGIALSGLIASRRATHPRQITEASLRFMTRRLHLDAEQRRAVRPIIERTGDQLEGIRQGIEDDVRAILMESEQEIREVLRPEQQRRFDRMIERRRAMRRQMRR